MKGDANFTVSVTYEFSRDSTGRNEGRDHNEALTGENECHLAGSPHVLVTVLIGETETARETTPQIVAVNDYNTLAGFGEELHECRRRGRLARAGEARQPNGFTRARHLRQASEMPNFSKVFPELG